MDGLPAPFRTKMVELIRPTTAEERRDALHQAGFDLFRVPAELVAIDLLTDSGTNAMSSRQWAAMMQASDAYANSPSYRRFMESVADVTGFADALPTQQGRASERLLVETLIGRPGDPGPWARGSDIHPGQGLIIPNNAHFDTTRRAIEASGAEAVNLLPDGAMTMDAWTGGKVNRADDRNCGGGGFKGDMDVAALEKLLGVRGRVGGGDVPMVMMTLTCNSNGGQPVSLANLRAVAAVCKRFGVMLVLDACRVVENAELIRQREPGQSQRPIRSIVREIFDFADGAVMSARKDALANCGGVLLLRDPRLLARARGQCVMTQGFTATYGPLAGRDLEAIAVGLQEAVDDQAAMHRIQSVARLGEQLQRGGVDVVRPVGGHAVYIDAEAFCPHIAPDECPGLALACALYEQLSVRAIRIGTVIHGRSTARQIDLVRLAIPRRVYSGEQLDAVAAGIIRMKSSAASIKPIPAQHRPSVQRATLAAVEAA